MKLFSILLGGALALGLGLSAARVEYQDASKAKPVATQAQKAKPAAMDEAAMIAKQVASYPLSTCPVSGEALTEMGEPVDLLHEGRLVRFCCKSCVKAFKKDPAATLAKVDAAIVAAQLPLYPLAACPVSGEDLGSMGEPLNKIHGTRLVRLCCKGCVKGFDKDPGAAMAKVDAALIEKLKPMYTATTCPVSGEALDSMGEPIDYLHGVQLVRFCCKGCVKKFEKDPASFLAKVVGTKSAPAKKLEKKG